MKKFKIIFCWIISIIFTLIYFFRTFGFTNFTGVCISGHDFEEAENTIICKRCGYISK